MTHLLLHLFEHVSGGWKIIIGALVVGVVLIEVL